MWLSRRSQLWRVICNSYGEIVLYARFAKGETCGSGEADVLFD